MSTCDKRYKTAGPNAYPRAFNQSALAKGMVRQGNYMTRGNSEFGPKQMSPGPYSGQASQYVTAANGQVEVPIASCAPVALAPAPLQECATECTKKVACFCGGSYFLSEKGKMY